MGVSAPATTTERSAPPAWFFSFIPFKMGSGSILSLTPLFMTDVLGASVAAVGVASSLSSAAAVPAAWFWGWLSDRVGTGRLYLMLGFLGFAIPTALMAASRDVFSFALLAVGVGALSMAATPVSSTLIMDTLPSERWDDAFGRFNQVGGWALVAGRMVGLLWMTYAVLWWGNAQAQRWLWLVGGGLGLLSVLAAWQTVPVRKGRRRRPGARPHLHEVLGRTGYNLVERTRYLPHSIHHLPTLSPLRAGRLLARTGIGKSVRWLARPLDLYYLVSFVLFTSSVMAYTPFAVWQRQDLGNAANGVFLVGMINSVAAALSYRWVSERIQQRDSLLVQAGTLALRVLVFGGFAAISFSGLTGAPALAFLVGLQALSGLSWAGIAVAGNTTVAHLAPRGHEGAAVGVYNSFMGLGSILGAFISGYAVLWLGYGFVFAIGAGGIALTVLLLLLIRRRMRWQAGRK